MNNTIDKSSPKFLYLLCFTEMWERFSYYGMRALLVLFLVQNLGFSDSKSYSIYCLFAAIGYIGPLVGGVLADKLLGFRTMVTLGSIIMVIGHTTMVFIPYDTKLLYFGLGLIAVGTGMFKGNITNLLGCCYDEKDPGRDSGFTMFHVSVNIGSLLAAILCGFVADAYGWHYGFALAGIGMLLGLVTFFKFQGMLGDHGLPPKKAATTRTVDLVFAKISFNIQRLVFILCLISAALVGVAIAYSQIFSSVAAFLGFIPVIYLLVKSFYMNEKERKSIYFLLILGFFFVMFFTLEMQIGSLFALFTERNVDKVVFGQLVPAAVSQGINPFSIMLLGPFIAMMFRKSGTKFSMMRFALAIMCMILCFGVLLVGCDSADSRAMVPYSFLFGAICIMGLGELFMAPVIYNLYTIFSPAKMRGFMMGILMLAASFANLAGNIVAKFMSVSSANIDLADNFASLAVYRAGFIDVIYFNIGVLALFMILYPFLNKFVQSRSKGVEGDIGIIDDQKPIIAAE